MKITLNIPDDSDMAAEIAAWEDGSEYEFRATQTAPNTFDVTEAAPAEAEPAEGEPAPEAAPTPDEGAYGNPAVDRLMKRP